MPVNTFNPYDTDLAAINRKRELANALLQKSLQGDPNMNTPVGGHVTRKSILGPLAQVFQAYIAKKQMGEADTEQKALGESYQQKLADALAQSQTAMKGAPETQTPFQADTFDAQDQPFGSMATVNPAQAPDPQKAAMALMNSGHPVGQQLGQQLLLQAYKNMEPKKPEWILGERFNEQTGRREKFMYDKNNPAQMMPIGGAQAPKVVADNLGGKIVYRGEDSITPMGMAEKTVTPDAVMTDQRVKQEGALNRGVTLRGQALTDARGREANALKAREVGIIGGKQAFDAEGKMADDFKAQSKVFADVRDGYTRLNASLKNATNSAAATLAGATSFMKLLDPGSVVRESELGMALQASGVLDRAKNYYKTLQMGKVLTKSQAKDFENIGAKIYDAAKANQTSLEDQYKERAKNYGLNPKNIITDYTIKNTEPEKPLPAGWSVKER